MILSIVLLITVFLSVACCIFQIVAIKKLNDITEKEKRKIDTMQHNNIALFENMKKLREERPHGEWIHTDECDEEFQYRCSNCNLPMQSSSHFFCPNCGASMMKEGDK